MKDCDICQAPRHYSELIRLYDHWYCIRCIAAAVKLFSHEKNEDTEPTPEQSKALATIDQWRNSQQGKNQP